MQQHAPLTFLTSRPLAPGAAPLVPAATPSPPGLQVVGFYTQAGKKYKFEEEATAEALEKFAKARVGGLAGET